MSDRTSTARSGMSAPTTRDGDIERDETHSLISADKVEGTAVYDRNGNRLGSIDTVMIEKRSGHVEYAVLSFGGILGLGASHYPLPWNQLTYDTRHGGYVVDVTEEQLRGAPTYGGSESEWEDPAYTGRIRDYYGMGAMRAGL
jgi:sporulation protein YlmC with PRC-barrel domain